MSDQQLVQILEGNTFVVSDERGDIEASLTDPTGLFSFDTRHLSRWVLTVNGQRLTALSTDDLQYFQTRFFLVPGSGTVYVDSKMSVIRQREVSDGFSEDLRVLNHENEPVDLVIRIEAASDFADLFEVKDALKKKGSYASRISGSSLVLSYHRETYGRETWISSTAKADVDDHGFTFNITVPGHGEWSTELNVVASEASADEPGSGPIGIRGQGRKVRHDMARGLEKWLQGAPQLECDWQPMETIYKRCMTDLAALRFSTLTMPGRSLPAAGLPWFMTIFGRDSIFTSLQSLPFTSELAATTLLALAERQGTRIDDFRDEDPGRILHEMRYGELTAFEERPHSPYYGSADATPLYVVLLDEYERWTGDVKLVRSLEHVARAAISWIDEYADLQGNGYISYQRRNADTGLENQCWKDSWDSISYRNGDLPGFPRATCELQGYAYDAKMRAARLARQVWKDPAFADRLEKEAADLKRRFNRDFWVEDGEYFAVALEADGRQVDSLTSNIGHLLWSGIVDKSKARSRGPAPDEPAAVLRLGRPDAGRGPGPVQPDRLPRRHGLAIRQLVHRLGTAPVRLQGRGRRHRGRASWRQPRCSRAGCRRRSAATRAARPGIRCSTRRPAARKPGRPARRCCCSGPRSGSSQRASTWSSTRPCRTDGQPGAARSARPVEEDRRVRPGPGQHRPPDRPLKAGPLQPSAPMGTCPRVR